jgi:hypothetical protein
MKLRILLACRTSKRLAREARSSRRALRDHLRKEFALIRELEIRARGLRLTLPGLRAARTSFRPALKTGLKRR